MARVLVEEPCLASELNATELADDTALDPRSNGPRRRIAQSSSRSHNNVEQRVTSVSKLGLVRVAPEAACTIDATFENGVVRITADMKLV